MQRKTKGDVVKITLTRSEVAEAVGAYIGRHTIGIAVEKVLFPQRWGRLVVDCRDKDIVRAQAIEARRVETPQAAPSETRARSPLGDAPKPTPPEGS